MFRRLTPAQYFPIRHAGTPRMISCLRQNFQRNVHGFQSGQKEQTERFKGRTRLLLKTRTRHCPVDGRESPALLHAVQGAANLALSAVYWVQILQIHVEIMNQILLPINCLQLQHQLPGINDSHVFLDSNLLVPLFGLLLVSGNASVSSQTSLDTENWKSLCQSNLIKQPLTCCVFSSSKQA